MPKEKYTAIVVSEDSETTRQYHIGRRTFRAIIGIVAVIVILVVASAVYFVPRAIDYDRLKGRHQTLMAERMKVASLIRDLERIKEMNSRIQQALGVDLVLPGDSLEQISPSHTREDVPVSFLDNIPSYMPVEGFVTQDFYRDPLIQVDDHLALDIAATSGTAVHAAAGGMVVFSGWTYQSGNLVIIFHGDGYFSLYGHSQVNLVRERQFVERGELIALVGESGITTGPHLHFEIWKDGQPVDPKVFIVEYRAKHS